MVAFGVTQFASQIPFPLERDAGDHAPSGGRIRPRREEGRQRIESPRPAFHRGRLFPHFATGPRYSEAYSSAPVAVGNIAGSGHVPALEALDRPPQACLFDQLGRFAGRHPDAAPLLLFRPITLLPAYLQWKDLDVADHRLLSFQSSRAELANVLFAYRSAHAGFFVGLDRCRLLRRAVLDRPAFRHRPSALFPGGDQQDFESLFRMRYGTAANCLNFTDYPPKAAAT
jgi:hypothetical protein